MANHSNSYVDECKRRYPKLDVWKRRTDSRPINISYIYQFISIIYYNGIVRLPSKEDYWSNEPLMSTHDLCIQLGMSRNRFRFLWRFFHCNFPIETDFDEVEQSDVGGGANEEEETVMVQQVIERVQREQEEDDNEDEIFDDGGAIDQNRTKQSVWFNKLEPFINHFRQVSESLIFTLGTKLSFDEMMIRFMGRSNETHRVKNKPIGEGFKFFVLPTSDGFVVNFTSDGRSTAKNNELEYEENKSLGKIECMIIHVLSVVDRLKEKQKKRIQTKYNKISTRGNSVEQFESEPSQDDRRCIIIKLICRI